MLWAKRFKSNTSFKFNGDYGGGGMHLAFGIVSGLIHALKTGEGQVVDSAMVDGSYH